MAEKVTFQDGGILLDSSGDFEVEVPAKGALAVEVRAAEGGPLGAAELEVSGPLNFGSSTGDDGRARIADLPSGTYNVSARAVGFKGASKDVPVAAAEAQVAFALERASSRIDLEVRRKGGASLFGAEVAAEGPSPARGRTGTGGKLLFDRLEAGQYRLTARAQGFADASSQVSLSEGETAATTLELGREQGRLKVRVLRLRGVPVASARIAVFGGTRADGVSNAEGEAAFDALDTGDYTVAVSAEGSADASFPATISAGEERTLTAVMPAPRVKKFFGSPAGRRNEASADVRIEAGEEVELGWEVEDATHVVISEAGEQGTDFPVATVEARLSSTRLRPDKTTRYLAFAMVEGLLSPPAEQVDRAGPVDAKSLADRTPQADQPSPKPAVRVEVEASAPRVTRFIISNKLVGRQQVEASNLEVNAGTGVELVWQVENATTVELVEQKQGGSRTSRPPLPAGPSGSGKVTVDPVVTTEFVLIAHKGNAASAPSGALKLTVRGDVAPAAFVGIDRLTVNKTEHYRWVAAHSNLRLLGGYWQNDTRVRDFAELSEAGCGPFFALNALDGTNVGFHDHHASAANGETDAKKVKNLLHGHVTDGAVLYFDMETLLGNALNGDDRAYFRNFFRKLSTPDADGTFRGGIYGRNAVVAQVLVEVPDLFVWQAEYGTRNIGTDPQRQPFNTKPAPHTAASPPYRFDFQFVFGDTQTFVRGSATLNSNLLQSFAIFDPPVAPTPKPEPPRIWTCWPVARQWFGNNTISTPPREPAGSPLPQPPAVETGGPPTDCNTSFVRHLVDPIAEPRLCAFTGGGKQWLAVLKVRDAEMRDSNQPGKLVDLIRPESGELRLYQTGASGEIAAGTGNDVLLHSHSPLVVAASGGDRELFAVTVLRRNNARQLQLSSAKIPFAQASLQLTEVPGVAGMRELPLAIAACARNAQEVQAFFASPDQRLTALRRTGSTWEGPRSFGDDPFRIHPATRVAACARLHVVDVAAFDKSGLPTVVTWGDFDPWPKTVVVPIDGAPDRYLPAGPIAILAPTEKDLAVIALGKNLRLHVMTWSERTNWTPAVQLGSDDLLFHPFTQIDARVAGSDQLELVAVACTGTVTHLVLVRRGNSWTVQDAQPIGPMPTDDPLVTATPHHYPNPFSDFALWIADASGGRQFASVRLDNGFASAPNHERASRAYVRTPTTDWSPFRSDP